MIVESQGFLDEVLDAQDDHFSALPLLFCDNQSAIQIAKSSLPTKRSRHYNIRLSRLRELATAIHFVPTDYNKADPFTKALPAEKYRLLWWTDPYYPKAKVSTIKETTIKHYRKLGDKSGKWILENDESQIDSDENEFEDVKGFYSHYAYKLKSSMVDSKSTFDVEAHLSTCDNVKLYKLKK